MSRYLTRLSNVLLDVRVIMNQMEHNPRTEINNIKVRLKAALMLCPYYADKVDDLRTLNAVYGFAKYVLDAVKLEIQIEKED